MAQEAFGTRLMENSMRGIWCEYMIAEAIGPQCRPVSAGWHAWDLEVGDAGAGFPERIRIQVKNSARLQTWNVRSGKSSDCKFDLKYRKRPAGFEQTNPGMACEETGFLCDLFILCLHDCEDWRTADQTDPFQWKFYLLPVVGGNCAVTRSELDAAQQRVLATGRPATCIRHPRTMEAGIRGRPPVKPVGIEALSVATIRTAMGM